jgi:hypothetical protein
MNITNTGLQIVEPTKKDYKFGGQIRLGGVALVPSGQWDEWLPTEEVQNLATEPMACFPYNARVLTENMKYKRISDIRVGEYVISHTGNKRRVSKTLKRQYGKSPFVSIKVAGEPEPIICTPEHPFLTQSGWKNADTLSEDDKVFCPTPKPQYASLFNVENDEDFLWLVGLFLAEGSLGKRKDTIHTNKKLAVRGDGGGSGAQTTVTIPMHLLPDTLTVEVGCGGTGAAAGATGTTGTVSRVGVYGTNATANNVIAIAQAGAGGGGGSGTAAGTAGSAGAVIALMKGWLAGLVAYLIDK